MITAKQIRLARAMLRLDQLQLAEKACVSKAMLMSIETERLRLTPIFAASIKKALEAHGIVFENDGRTVRKRPAHISTDPYSYY